MAGSLEKVSRLTLKTQCGRRADTFLLPEYIKEISVWEQYGHDSLRSSLHNAEQLVLNVMLTVEDLGDMDAPHDSE